MRKQWLVGGLAAAFALAGLAFVQAQQADVAPTAVESPDAYPSGQPIAFPHNQHAGNQPGQNNMDCQFCHFSAERSVDAGIPPVSACWGCHQVVPGTNNPDEVAKIGQYWRDQQPIPWVRIYKVADHVHFPHMRHLNAGLEYQECHGPVQEMEVLQVQRTGLARFFLGQDRVWGGDAMGWCVQCHRESEASVDCAVCHY